MTKLFLTNSGINPDKPNSKSPHPIPLLSGERGRAREHLNLELGNCLEFAICRFESVS